MTPATWLDDEPSIGDAARQAGRLLVAGLRRKALSVGGAVVFASVLAGAVVWTPYSYAPEYVLRIVEPEADRQGMPRPRRQLAEYVRTAVFTSEPLLAIMTRHGLYAGLAKKSSRAALAAFRDRIDVEVHQNDFVEERAPGAPPRSARIVVSYRDADPAVAEEVTRELGELVVTHEREARAEQATHSAEQERTRVAEARDALAARRAEVAALAADLKRGDAPPGRRVAYIGKLGSLAVLEAKQEERERREASLSLGAALEARGVGMRFDVIDDASTPTDTDARRARALLAGTAFALGLPLLIVAVGAFARPRTS